MKSLTEVLRDADPLRHDISWDAHDRQIVRHVIATTPRVTGERRRTFPIAVILAVALVAAVSVPWYFWSGAVAAAVRFEVRLAEDTPGVGLREAPVLNSNRKVYLHQEVILSNSDVTRAQVIEGSTASTFGIGVTFTPEGATRMFRVTRSHIGRPLAILIDGEVAVAPIVRSPISASAVLSGHYTKAEAERIAIGIRDQ